MASNFQLRQAASILLHGGIISYQTDTIYGLSCDPYNQHALNNLNQIKQRERGKTFILLASDFSQLAPLLHHSVLEKEATICNTSQPTSWVVRTNSHTPNWLTAKNNTIAIRLSKDPVTKKICSLLNSPIISTSANISKQSPVKNTLQCRKIFGKKIHKTLTSQHPFSGKPSRLIRLCDNQVLRP